MNDTERHFEIERIRGTLDKIRAYEAVELQRRDLDVRMAAQAAAQRLGEAAVLHAIGEIDDDALRAVRDTWRDARDETEAVRLQVGGIQSLRQRLTDTLSDLTMPERAAEREQAAKRYAEMRAAFEREFPTMGESDVVANGKMLYDAACAVARSREVKDLFHGIRNRRHGALLQKFV